MNVNVEPIRTGNRLLDLFVGQVRRVLMLCVILNGKHVTEISATVAGFNVAHGLGRPWRGYILTNASAGVYLAASATQPDRSKILRLGASGAATIDLWVF